MAKERGFAVISGSSTVVARIMENGTVIFGQDKAATGSYSGTLVLNLPSGYGDGRVVHVNSVGSASLSELSASSVKVNPVNGITSTTVQAALEELQGEIVAAQASSNLVISGASGNGTIVLASESLKVLGTANQVDTTFDGVDTLRVKLTDNVFLSGSLTASTGVLVKIGRAHV